MIMRLVAQQDYFTLFGLPIDYWIDMDQLTHRYHELQTKFHPDRYYNASSQEKALVLQFTSFINDAYDILKSPLKRANYLLSLQDVFVDGEQTIADSQFLSQQMVLNELLSESAGQEEKIAEIVADLKTQFSEQCREFAEYWQHKEWHEAKITVQRMQFIERLLKRAEQ